MVKGADIRGSLAPGTPFEGTVMVANMLIPAWTMKQTTKQMKIQMELSEDTDGGTTEDMFMDDIPAEGGYDCYIFVYQYCRRFLKRSFVPHLTST